jgi:hypothetical protein
LVQGINLRGRQIPLHLQNPHNPSRYQPDTIRIKIKNVPLSADDGQIDRALAMEGYEIQGIFRDRLRVDGYLWNHLVLFHHLAHHLFLHDVILVHYFLH